MSLILDTWYMVGAILKWQKLQQWPHCCYIIDVPYRLLVILFV